MRKLQYLCVLLGLSACQQNVVAPTAKELIDNRQLLTLWQAKCDTGEYSHLPAERKTAMCATTNDATITLAVSVSGDTDSAFFEKNTLRKR